MENFMHCVVLQPFLEVDLAVFSKSAMFIVPLWSSNPVSAYLFLRNSWKGP